MTHPARQRTPGTACRLLLLLLLCPGSVVQAGAATLSIEDGGARTTLDTAALLARPDAAEVTVPHDGGYGGGERRYRAVPLAPLLSTFSEPTTDGTLEVASADGFVAEIPLALARLSDRQEPQAWLAIEPADAPWPRLPGKAATAGPFYIVWQHEMKGRVPSEYWAYQVTTLRHVPSPSVRWPQLAVDPALPADDPARAGQAVFASVCMTCHRLAGGGESEVGPDLNQPMSPTDYFQGPSLRRYIRDPASIRTWPDRRMPGFAPDQLSDDKLDAVTAYLAHMAHQHPPEPAPSASQ